MVITLFVLVVVIGSVTGVQYHDLQEADVLTINKREALTSCENGWFSFGNMCYKLGGKKRIGRMNFEKASEKCVKDGGRLASIHSKDEQDFILTFLLLDAETNAWLGLHDRVNESDYLWDDGSAINFTNWEPNEPSGIKQENEDCVEIVFRSMSGETGQWNDIDCNTYKPYICKKPKSKLNKSPDPRFCLPDEGGGWRFHNSCYTFVHDRVSWPEAESVCKEKYHGHLVTILQYPVELFLDYILRQYSQEVWIGIKMREEFQQQWSSGWFVSYNNWGKDKEDFIRDHCTVRTKKQEWVNVVCTRKFPFVCETSTVRPPVLKPAVEGASCPQKPEQWRDLGGEFCYFFDTKNYYTWYEANFMCMRRGGALVSIHSREEVNMLHQFVKYTQYALFIGLFRQMQHDGEFAWVDGSPLDLKMWRGGEPNSEDEMCVEVLTESMEWNDEKCDSKRGYICSMPKIKPNSTGDKVGQVSCPGGISYNALIGVLFCGLLLMVLLGIVVYYCRICERDQVRAKKSSAITLQPPVSIPQPQRRYRSAEIIVKDDSDYENAP